MSQKLNTFIKTRKLPGITSLLTLEFNYVELNSLPDTIV